MLNQKVSILIVDDDPAMRSLLEQTLRPGYDCVSAETAGEALRLMDTQSFQLALIDIGLPGMSGLTLCMVIVNRYPRTAVLMISGNTDEKSIADAFQAGASDYITKPFNLIDVLTAVERALKRNSPDAVA